MAEKKKPIKRLFLFAAYDAHEQVGASLIHYIKELSAWGDTVLFMDNPCPEAELGKLNGLTLCAKAQRHGEYDFGSYKRGYLWARENLPVEEYDYCYMVNDSVFGPLNGIGESLLRMEALGTDAFSLVLNPHRRTPHLQSWFIGMSRKVFLSEEFRTFITSVQAAQDKESVCVLYETGFTALLSASSFTYSGLWQVKGKGIYNKVSSLCRKGLPFFKKSAVTRHNGSLGLQVAKVLEHSSPRAKEAILSDMERLWGKEYTGHFLSGNALNMALRYAGYLSKKLFG